MAHILGIGIATLDIIITVDGYPREDDEVRALAEQRRRGGNVANTLAVLSRLGHGCTWGGVTVAGPDGGWILHDLKQYDIDVQHACIESQGKIPTSYILINRQNGSRTIVHYRDLREFSFQDFRGIDLAPFDWIHFEGRAAPETVKMLRYLRAVFPAKRCSIEIEKPRPDIEQLFPYADVLLFSRHYALAKGYDNASALLADMRKHTTHADIICAWGDQGAHGLNRNGQAYCSPAMPPPRVVDTLGAGDTFNAAVIHAYVNGKTLGEALQLGCELAGKKCGHMGLDFL